MPEALNITKVWYLNKFMGNVIDGKKKDILLASLIMNLCHKQIWHPEVNLRYYNDYTTIRIILFAEKMK